jgi:hypothetical protein
MPDEPKLTPATPDDLAQALAHGLRFNGRKQFHQGDQLMAQITAEHLIKHLELPGFVVMRKLPAPAHKIP